MSKHTDIIVALIGINFRSFGGGDATSDNPISAALADSPLQFAAGVDVKEVVEFVESVLPKLKQQKA